MYVRMYRGPDPVVADEESYVAVFGDRAAPCVADERTHKWWGTHEGFAQLKRYMASRGDMGRLDAWSVPLTDWTAKRALKDATLVWEGLV